MRIVVRPVRNRLLPGEIAGGKKRHGKGEGSERFMERHLLFKRDPAGFRFRRSPYFSLPSALQSQPDQARRSDITRSGSELAGVEDGDPGSILQGEFGGEKFFTTR